MLGEPSDDGRRRAARLAITVGDPAGIGPEIVIKAVTAANRPAADYAVYGPGDVLEDGARRLGITWPPENVRIVDVGPARDVAPGRASAAGGRVAAAAVLTASRDALGGLVDGIVTAPLNKESLAAAGHPWPGHTEMLADVAGVKDVAMLFVGGGLRVALVTIHRSLRSVPDAVTAEEVARVVRLVDRELPSLGADGRRIALCALNPHAGEAGLFGREEIEVLTPAVARLRAEGIDVAGPFPADSLFVRAVRGEFDAVVAQYHDQGLIPVKLVSFGNAVNVTLGLPFVRTSVDHGTGFDIVGKGTADPGSMIAAIELAVTLVASRRRLAAR